MVSEIKKRYEEDPLTNSILKRLTTKSNNDDLTEYCFQNPSDEKQRVVVPNIAELIEAVLFEYHDVETYGHSGMDRTLRLVEKDFYWRGLVKSVRSIAPNREILSLRAIFNRMKFPYTDGNELQWMLSWLYLKQKTILIQ
ncbi:DNA/RNA polymerase [Phytophthora palmivora]|uniref:DNA/RNA polymerase n=1 Tax=Phytophthora palmivora TaxID=4796 RepID=A0A2P4YCX9_9STRA|nr:DNA/RNA polymerase [Phytophthora palmivora]